MAVHPNPKNILVIGAGDGGVVRELTRYASVESIDLVEIDELVVEVCKKYLPTTACRFDDPRVHVYYEDGVKFIRRCTDQYDVIIVDSTDPFGPGEGLFTKEFYPLTALDYLIGSFDSDIITMDYRVRGFTRNLDGEKLFIDHDITSIQNYIDEKILDKYDVVDINVYQANMFHTKMLIKELDLQNYLFNTDVNELPPRRRLEITNALQREMIEIFSGRNVFGNG